MMSCYKVHLLFVFVALLPSEAWVGGATIKVKKQQNREAVIGNLRIPQKVKQPIGCLFLPC